MPILSGPNQRNPGTLSNNFQAELVLLAAILVGLGPNQRNPGTLSKNFQAELVLLAVTLVRLGEK
jgi:hypothetical protein